MSFGILKKIVIIKYKIQDIKDLTISDGRTKLTNDWKIIFQPSERLLISRFKIISIFSIPNPSFFLYCLYKMFIS